MGRDGEEGMGSLYRLNKDLTAVRILSGISISNGIIWSPDGRSMYHTDTLSREIWCFDYNDSEGTISNRRVAVRTAESDGFPDGFTIDAEGRLWAAHWSGGKVICYDPGGRKED